MAAHSELKPNCLLKVVRNFCLKYLEYHLWTILDALGIPRCGLYAFRHTHTALLLDSGASPKVVQRQLRHSDARTTLEIYGHVWWGMHTGKLSRRWLRLWTVMDRNRALATKWTQ